VLLLWRLTHYLSVPTLQCDFPDGVRDFALAVDMNHRGLGGRGAPTGSPIWAADFVGNPSSVAKISITLIEARRYDAT
jgi:hypothetical protein